MAQSPEMLNNEEFEKVDPYQDENISSTSMTGEMAEEDRYQGDAVSGGSLLDDEYTSTVGQPAAYHEESDPLISFDPSPPPAPIPETTVTEPTPPPTAKSEPEPTVTGGAWLENVDPRGAESKDELMASPESLADSSTERKASSGAEPESDGQIGTVLTEGDSGSESDTSMSLDGSGESSDTDSDSRSELSVSDTDEKDLEEKEHVVVESMNKGADALVEGGDFGVSGNIASPETEENGSDVAEEEVFNKNKELDSSTVNEALNNAYMVDSVLKESASKSLVDEDVSKQIEQAISSLGEGSEKNEGVQGEDFMRHIGKDELEMLRSHGEKVNVSEMISASGLISDGNICSPYYEDMLIGNSGSSEGLEKQLDTTCLQEEGISLSDSGQNILLDKTSSNISVEKGNLYRGNYSECGALSGATDITDSDTMEANMRLGILKSDLRVCEEFGSGHNSDTERASNHSEELHVHFKDEVVVMEFSDEEKEEESHKLEQTEDFVESIPSDYMYPQDVNEFIEKDSFESMENKENGTSANAPELNFSLYKIPKTEDRSSSEGENSDEFSQKKESVEVSCLYSEPNDSELAVLSAVSENNTKNLEKDNVLELTDMDYVVERKRTDISIEEAELKAKENSDDSKSESEDNTSDEEEGSASGSSDEGNISGEWNVSPLCDIDQADTENALIADIPGCVEENSEIISSDNVCLLNYTPIDEDVQIKEYERQDTLELAEKERGAAVEDVSEDISKETAQADECIPSSETEEVSQEMFAPMEVKEDSSFQEKGSEPGGGLDVEEQLKAVEKHLLARLISDSDAHAFRAEPDLEVKSLEIVEHDKVLMENLDIDKTYDDEAKDDEMEKYMETDKESVSLTEVKQGTYENTDEITELIEEIKKEANEISNDNNDVSITDSGDLKENSAQGVVEECHEALNVLITEKTPDLRTYKEAAESALEDAKLETKSFKILAVDSHLVSEQGNKESVEQSETLLDTTSENTDEQETKLIEQPKEEQADEFPLHDIVEVTKDERPIEKKSSTRIVEVIQQVVELIYWRDVRKTGIVFGSMMFVLISLACFSLLSVLAYMSICVLTVTFTFRVYKSIMQAVQKTNEGHPFKKLLEMNIELKDEVVQDAAENIAKHLNCCHRELRRLYLVEDYVDSVKFGMMLWLLTYIGSWFSGMTLIILVVVSIFTLPRVYETYKVQIDQYINMARAQLNKILAQISAKIPFPKKKAKTQ